MFQCCTAGTNGKEEVSGPTQIFISFSKLSEDRDDLALVFSLFWRLKPRSHATDVTQMHRAASDSFSKKGKSSARLKIIAFHTCIGLNFLYEPNNKECKTGHSSLSLPGSIDSPEQ